MSAEHAMRWQHRTHAATTTHWHGDHVAPGAVEDCPTCGPHEFTENINDCSMCICGIPALTHHVVFPPTDGAA